MLTALGRSPSLHADKKTLRNRTNHAQYLERLRVGARTLTFGSELGFHFKVAQSLQDAKTAQQTASVVEVSTVEELDELPMWQQGDVSLATVDKMAARQRLRYTPPVRRVLHAFWSAAQRSLQSGGDESADHLHKEGYALMLQRVYRLLIEEYEPADADAAIEEDWQNDARGDATLSREQFCDAVFQIAVRCVRRPSAGPHESCA